KQSLSRREGTKNSHGQLVELRLSLYLNVVIQSTLLRSGPMQRFTNFVDGKPVEPQGGCATEVLDPATGAPYASAPVSAAEDVEAAMVAADRAFDEWAGATPAQRQLALFRIADELESRIDEVVKVESADTGKPIAMNNDEE